MTLSQYQNLVEQFSKSQLCLDLMGLSIDEVISRVNGNDVLGEAVAKAAYQQITRNYQA